MPYSYVKGSHAQKVPAQSSSPEAPQGASGSTGCSQTHRIPLPCPSGPTSPRPTMGPPTEPGPDLPGRLAQQAPVAAALAPDTKCPHHPWLPLGLKLGRKMLVTGQTTTLPGDRRW